MATLKAFTMPKWGIEMSEGLIAEWLVAEGSDFERGTLLTLIETDKITNEVEAEAPGQFVRIIAEAGGTYPVGALLAVLGDASTAVADIDAFVAAFKPVDASFAGADVDETPEPAPEPVAEVPPPPGLAISPAAFARASAAGIDASGVTGSGRGGRVTLQDVDQASRPEVAPALVGSFAPTPTSNAFASPMARRLAQLLDVDLTMLAGSGPRGRICKADVLSAASSVPAHAPATDTEYETIAMTPMRKAIARRLTESKTSIPHFYVRRRVRADRLLALRAAAPAPRPSINDYLVRACALALMEVPQLNIQVHGTEVRRFAHADIAIAVATEKGLITPILRAADTLGVAEISGQATTLAARARDGKLVPDDYAGGSFSLSNLGPFGVEQFDAIINPPQGAILAVGMARPEPIDDDGAVRIVPVLHLSLSCDHRAIDGADGGRFLAAVAELIRQPERL